MALIELSHVKIKVAIQLVQEWAAKASMAAALKMNFQKNCSIFVALYPWQTLVRILTAASFSATAEKYCDKFILLHNGEIRAQGTLAQLRSQFQAPEASLDDLYLALTKESQA